jgi:hypothetical protein
VDFSRLAARWRTVLLCALPLMLAFPAAALATVQWTSGESISAAGGNASQPDVAALPSGQAIAIWSRNDTSLPTPRDRVQVAVRNSAGAWGAASTLSSTSVRAYEPKIATDPNGNAIAVWTTDDGTTLRVQAAYRPSGGSFGAVQTIGDPGFEPEVSIDAQGNAVAAWTFHDSTVNRDRIRVATRPAGTSSTFVAPTTVSTDAKNAFEPEIAAEDNGNAVAVWSVADGTLQVQSSSRLDVPGYARPQAAASLRVPLMIAFKACTAGTANRQHGPTLAGASCNPPQQESAVATIGTFDANGFQPQHNGTVKITVCGSGTTATGTCSTPAGMSSPDVRIEHKADDVRCRVTNTACPGGFGSDYPSKLLLRVPLRITDKNNGTLANDPATVSDLNFNAPITCVSTPTTIGATCNIVSSANGIMPGATSGGKRANWELGQIETRDAGPNGTGYDSCPGTCGDGDETTFERQGIFIP